MCNCAIYMKVKIGHVNCMFACFLCSHFSKRTGSYSELNQKNAVFIDRSSNL